MPEQFAVGQRVRARVVDPEGHCRLPRYIRGHAGTIVADHGTSVVADRQVAGEPDSPEPVWPCVSTRRSCGGRQITP